MNDYDKLVKDIILQRLYNAKNTGTQNLENEISAIESQRSKYFEDSITNFFDPSARYSRPLFEVKVPIAVPIEVITPIND